jgi:predicted dehydrogenase
VIYDDGASEPVRLFDRGVVYEDPATFGEYHLSYRTGDILSPKLETFEPLGAEIADFLDSIRTGARKEYELALARTVVRMVEAADQSLKLGGREIKLDHADIGESFAAQRRLAIA